MKHEGFFVKYRETAQSQPSTRPIRRLEMVGDVAQSLASELAQIRIIEISSTLITIITTLNNSIGITYCKLYNL